ncbi:G-patch-domain-containing protein [Dissoconium aciculare CBS 342.82]|uniref:G-patch-domain-containing protein n=1 Tax=Dissoconium aciculare CBS 342.82 TaxID=1314786 RepID=A0A6J3LUB1_9PEZI|nr:G-patch-domain-containing protein [Dissoconium aciculare CBS 342.82]KAF1819370.1 G-patch-domain-containing protein [Dissoconium aciculare CBS 342.82]
MSNDSQAAGEDDYLSMSFNEETAHVPESSLQRTARLKREAASRAHQPRKRELEERAAKAQQAILDTALDSSSIGAKMLSKMGFKEGGTLGKSADALREPIRVNFRHGKGGLGVEREKRSDDARTLKRNRDGLIDATAATANRDHVEKRAKVSENEYRERAQLSAEERRAHGKLTGAMKVLETLEDGASKDEGREMATLQHVPLHSVNVLRRPLARERLREDRERMMQLIKAEAIAVRDRPDDISDPKRKFIAAADVDLEESDSELEEFEAQPIAEQLEKVVEHLREQHNYCYWCMGQYPDEGMEGCPGLTEDEHG